jgi:hypothetical protein
MFERKGPWFFKSFLKYIFSKKGFKEASGKEK